MKCDFCQEEGDWKYVLRDISILKVDGSDLFLCNDCMTNYATGKYDKIKLKGDKNGTK